MWGCLDKKNKEATNIFFSFWKSFPKSEKIILYFDENNILFILIYLIKTFVNSEVFHNFFCNHQSFQCKFRKSNNLDIFMKNNKQSNLKITCLVAKYDNSTRNSNGIISCYMCMTFNIGVRKHRPIISFFLVWTCNCITCPLNKTGGSGGEGNCGHDRMVVGFTTTCAMSAYHN